MNAKLFRLGLILFSASVLAACASSGRGKDTPLRIPEVTDPAPIVSGTMRPYQIKGRWYRPHEQPDYDETGIASWYGSYHHGRPTSTGERFDMNALTAAHKTLPLPSLVEVTNPANGRRVVLRVNDRGPFVDGRIIDLSKAAAEELGLMGRGVGEVRVRYVGRAPRSGGGMTLQTASASPSTPRAAPSSTSVPYNQVAQAETTRSSAPASIPVPALSPQMAPIIAPVTAPQVIVPPAPPAYTSVLGSAPSGHWVQAGAYADQASARRFAERLSHEAQIQAFQADGLTYYRILVGPWPSETAAERARQAVIARGYRDALLISGG